MTGYTLRVSCPGCPQASTAGIDTAAEGAQNIWLTIAGTGNWAVMIFGAVALFLIRGRVSPDTTIDEGAFAAKPA